MIGQNLQNQEKIVIDSQNTVKKTNSSLIIFFLILMEIVIVSGAFYFGIKFSENKQVYRDTLLQKNKNEISVKNNEISQWYSVEYPNDFFITFKNYNTFRIAQNKWKGKEISFPEAGISTYINVIPEEMDLKEWVNKIGSSEGNQSCKDFIDRLKQELKSDSFLDLKDDNCFYANVSNVKDIMLNGLPAVNFETENISSAAKHTIAKYKDIFGNIILFDIYYTITGSSEGETDPVVKAYQSLLDTFRIR